MKYTYNEKQYDRIVFDVGANNGSTTIPLAKSQPNTIVFAFEPTPKLVDDIKEQTTDIENYIIVQTAVSNYTGKSKFNLMQKYDWGCSSLLEFSENTKNGNIWEGCIHEVTDSIEVDVITLKTFIEENNIPTIDFLHIDTQGSDLNVLRGMGEHLSIVIEGQMEAALIEDALYVGQNRKEECIEFLESNGFDFLGTTHVNPNETNIHFKKKN